MRNNERRDTAVAATDDYEVEIGKTVFHVHHEFGDTELDELIADYLTAKQITATEKRQAA